MDMCLDHGLMCVIVIDLISITAVKQWLLKLGSQCYTGAYVASVASSLVHNMTLELM